MNTAFALNYDSEFEISACPLADASWKRLEQIIFRLQLPDWQGSKIQGTK